jgi:lysocardiolipin and lysophospholipid acyltransferase
LFILRTLLPSLPDLQLLDITIGYPGVPFGKYPQEWYGLVSVFFRSVPPPTVHLHLHLHGDLLKGEDVSGIPSLISSSVEEGDGEVKSDTGLASPEEAKSFELWLRGKWLEKEDMMEKFSRDQRFTIATEDEGGGEGDSEDSSSVSPHLLQGEVKRI